MQGNSKGARASQKTCMFLQPSRGLLLTHPNRILPFEITLAIISDLGWSVSSLVHSHFVRASDKIWTRVHTESQPFLSQRLFWKDPVLEALDQQDRSWEVVQMGFWAWKLHFLLDQWQMFLNLFAVALVFFSSQSCQIWKTSRSNKTVKWQSSASVAKIVSKQHFVTSGTILHILDQGFQQVADFLEGRGCCKTKPPKETGDTWLTHESHPRSQILSKPQKTGIRMHFIRVFFVVVFFLVPMQHPNVLIVSYSDMELYLFAHLFACETTGRCFPHGTTPTIHGWSSGLGMPQYYDYFIAKGFTYGAKLRWMTRKYLVPWMNRWGVKVVRWLVGWLVWFGLVWFGLVWLVGWLDTKKLEE